MLAELVQRTAAYIAGVQLANGGIPWFPGGIVDPWDHVEAAMGLTIGGRVAEAEAAYDWLVEHQHPDGYWLAAYNEHGIVDGTRAESNFVAYLATGVWHHFLATGDSRFLERLWPTVHAALEFVLSLQAPSGEIYWAWDTRTGINKDALLTGCSSIYRSLDCGIAIANVLGEPSRHWRASRAQLGHSIAHRPERFDRTWESKSRYSMDWFYPLLAGLFSSGEARSRLDSRWDQFVEPGLGCRCVADQPWITVAETCELIMACVAADAADHGKSLFDQLRFCQAEDGSWWTGYVFTEQVMWPDERPTWTAGAVLLAADALHRLTSAADIFTSAVAHSDRYPPQRTERLYRF